MVIEHLKKNIVMKGTKGFSDEQKELLKSKIFYQYFVAHEIPFLYVAGYNIFKVEFIESKIGYSFKNDEVGEEEVVKLIFKITEIKEEDNRLRG